MSETDRIDIRFNDEKQRYEAALAGGDRLAFLSVRRSADLWELPSTYVPEEFSGKGVGSALVRRVLADARAESVQISPQCPFISAYIKRHEHEADLVHPDHLHLIVR